MLEFWSMSKWFQCVKKKSHIDSDNDQKPTKIRGPVCPDFIFSYIAAIAASVLEKLFNQVIAIFFPKNVMLCLMPPKWNPQSNALAAAR